MQEYLSQVRCIQTKFESFDLSYIPRNGNIHADSLATIATSSAQDLPISPTMNLERVGGRTISISEESS